MCAWLPPRARQHRWCEQTAWAGRGLDIMAEVYTYWIAWVSVFRFQNSDELEEICCSFPISDFRFLIWIDRWNMSKFVRFPMSYMKYVSIFRFPISDQLSDGSIDEIRFSFQVLDFTSVIWWTFGMGHVTCVGLSCSQPNIWNRIDVGFLNVVQAIWLYKLPTSCNIIWAR